MNMTYKFKLFLAPAEEGQLQPYSHTLLAIAEGLQELELDFMGNLNYWQLPGQNRTLIQKASASYKADIHIYQPEYFYGHPHHFTELDPNKFNIIVDDKDGVGMFCYLPQYQSFDLILRAQYSQKQSYPTHVKPWAFGLTNRIIETLQQSDKQDIKEHVLLNYRCDHNIRRMAVEAMRPILEQRYPTLHQIDKNMEAEDKGYHELTQGKHFGAYFRVLNSSLLTYCFGGNFTLKLPFHQNLISALKRKYLTLKESIVTNHLHQLKTYKDWIDFWPGRNNYYINQFDSWRLWETLASNSLPMHLDFEESGFLLPEMPVNKTHYWGVTNLDFESSAKELVACSKEKLQDMAATGRTWTLKHYAPRPTAERLISYIK